MNRTRQSNLIPYLATDMPKVSSNGPKRTTITLRNLKYSDGSPVKASDFAATIERDFKVDSPGVGFFTNIVGADTFAKTKKGHITGITAGNTAGTIPIKLKAARG